MSPTLRDACLALVAALLVACGEERREPPHVILVSIDALRHDHVGAYGYARDTTPALDALAARGVVFERAYTVAPWTLIAHMTMLTGLYPEQHGVVADGHRLADEVPTLAERMRQLGYHTASLYHEGWIHQRFGFDRGFDVVSHHRRADAMARHLDELMDARPRERPLFLFLHVWDVHCQDLDAPGTSVYDPPADLEEQWVPGARARVADADDAKAIYLGRATPTDAEREALVALYDGGVLGVDRVLGRFLETCEAQGVLDDALVIVTSDHGEALAQRPGSGSHGSFFEEGLRIPLVVKYPGDRAAGTRHDGSASLVDVLPTVLAEAGADVEPWRAGRALQEPLPRERVVLMQRPPSAAIVRWPYKLVRPLDAPPERGKAFDLAADPRELAPKTRATDREGFERIRDLLLGAAGRLRAGWAPVPGAAGTSTAATPEEAEALRAMGYLQDGDG